MQTKIKNNIIFIRLFPDEDLFQSLERICQQEKVNTAIIISGIGQLKNFELGFFKEKDNYLPQKFLKPYELLNLSGIISKQNDSVSSSRGKYRFHLHAVLSDEKKKAIGGHLIKGIVEITNEIVLQKFNIKINRKIENKTGLEELFLPLDSARGKE